MERVLLVLTFIAAIGSAILGGVFFAFSCFVMAALGRLPSEQGTAAMNAINVTILNPGFFFAFFGIALACSALAVIALFQISEIGAKLTLAASLIYIVGTIGATMAFNVPLNAALASVQAGSPESASLWSRYVNEWTAWNQVRTIASIISAILFTTALMFPAPEEVDPGPLAKDDT
jgi:uncharacterized membrane protein